MMKTSALQAHIQTDFTGLNIRVNPISCSLQETAGKSLGSLASIFPEIVSLPMETKAWWSWVLPPRPLEAQPSLGVQNALTS